MGVFDIARQLRPALYQPAQNRLVHGFRPPKRRRMAITTPVIPKMMTRAAQTHGGSGVYPGRADAFPLGPERRVDIVDQSFADRFYFFMERVASPAKGLMQKGDFTPNFSSVAQRAISTTLGLIKCP
jgi:hypothetical protein